MLRSWALSFSNYYTKEKSTLKVSFSQCVKINPDFNGRPIKKKDFETWIEFEFDFEFYALIQRRRLTFKVDYSLTKEN